jgi:hypothetical protein
MPVVATYKEKQACGFSWFISVHSGKQRYNTSMGYDRLLPNCYQFTHNSTNQRYIV